MRTVPPISVEALPAQLSDPTPGPVIVDLDTYDERMPVRAPHGGVAHVVVGVSSVGEPESHPAAACCDVALSTGSELIDAVVERVRRHPLASSALAMLLRGSAERSVEDGLQLESAVYSTLQAGPEFAAVMARRERRVRVEDGDAVRLERHGDDLEVRLARPQVRNALNRLMRDQLVEAFEMVALDPSITRVHLRGEGPSFCAGGDLDEFGTFPDVATAHVVRLRQSAGRGIHGVADRVSAHLHGACVGSGIELPAFAGIVLGDASTRIALPEVDLGLIPGAGGTVSLPRRIGRHRTARLALTGETIELETALAWGLVDHAERGGAAASS